LHLVNGFDTVEAVRPECVEDPRVTRFEGQRSLTSASMEYAGYVMTGLRRGSSAIDVVLQLIAHHDNIARVKFIEYPPRPTFKQVARRTRRTFEETIQRRLQHGGVRIEEYCFPKADLTSARLKRLIHDLPGKGALAISSEVALNSGQPAHIPLIDFQCRQSPQNLAHLTVAMKHAQPSGGIILRTVESYHFYGKSLLTPGEWQGFIGRCLLLEPLVDVRYLGHCLLDGFAALRISGRGRQANSVPTIEAIF
jgi:hypothetical protein